MAKATKTEIPIDSTTGRIGRTDNTIGRDRGFAVNMTDNTADGSVKLSTKRTVTKGGSSARHAQVGKYCKCDVRYKGLDALRKDRLTLWYKTMLWIKSVYLTPYMLWMKVCLLAWPELSLFVDYCFYGRWRVYNPNAFPLEGVSVTLTRLIYPLSSLGTCVAVLVPQEHHDGTVLTKVGFTPDTLTVVLPKIDTFGVCFVDVYWHYNPAKGAQP